jgi:hypothetical protein
MDNVPGWNPIPATPDWTSDDGKFVAVYHHTERGHACYYVFHADQPKKVRKNAVAMGGLPGLAAMDNIRRSHGTNA